MTPAVAAVAIVLVVWLAAVLLVRGLRRLFRRRPAAAPALPVIVVDGSNVMHWSDDGVPRVETVVAVIRHLQAQGYAPIVHFDANVGYKLGDRAMSGPDLAAVLPLGADRIRVAPSRTPADPLLIAEALARDARIVSNDRFMDWRADHPRLRDAGRLVGGRVRGQRVEMRL